MNRQILVPAVALLALAACAPVSAQWPYPGDRGPSYGYGYSEVRQIAFDRGYREGLIEGERDGRWGDAFRYQDERDFQRADNGYSRRYGNIEVYRQAFRSGFADGYADGYRRYARGYGWGDGRYGDPRYGGGYGTYPPGRGGAYLTAFDIGARDGFEKGREDARDNRPFDPRRHRWYREGDREYNDRFGSRERYKDEYRRGFIAGYERGYR